MFIAEIPLNRPRLLHHIENPLPRYIIATVSAVTDNGIRKFSMEGTIDRYISLTSLAVGESLAKLRSGEICHGR